MITPLAPYPAALLRSHNSRTIVITDLHIGWEMALSNEGIHVPTQTPKLLKKLQELLSLYKTEKLLILGDIKHTVATAERIEWQDVPDFFSQITKIASEISIIRGNHDGNLDPLLPEAVKTLPATGFVMNDVGFFHGHQWPSPVLLKCRTLVMGHVHPIVVFRDRAGFRVTKQVWVKADCNTELFTKVLLQKHKIKIKKKPAATLYDHYRIKPRTSQLFIMPSFNDFLGGRPLNERKAVAKANAEMAMGPVLRSEAFDMRDAEIYLLDGTFLGTLEQLSMPVRPRK